MIRTAFCLFLMAVPVGASGPQVSAAFPVGEVEMSADLAQRISRFWNTGLPEVAGVRSVVRVSFDDLGRVSDVALLESDATTGSARDAAFGAARFAILRTEAQGGLGLTQQETRPGLILTFDPAAAGAP